MWGGVPRGFYKSEAGVVCMNGCVPWHPSPLWIIISWSLLSKGRSESCTPTHRCGRWSIVETVIKQTHFPGLSIFRRPFSVGTRRSEPHHFLTSFTRKNWSTIDVELLFLTLPSCVFRLSVHVSSAFDTMTIDVVAAPFNLPKQFLDVLYCLRSSS